MDYGRYVTRVWEVFSRNRVLWWLGMVVALLSGVISMMSIGLPFMLIGVFADAAFLPDEPSVDFATFLAQWGGFIGTVGCVTVILSFILSFVSAAGGAALVAATDHIERTGEKLTLGAAWRVGAPRQLPGWAFRSEE